MRINPIIDGINRDQGITEYATRTGIGLKTGILLLIAIASGVLCLPFSYLLLSNPVSYILLVVIGFICCLVGQTYPKYAMPASVAYAIIEGMFLGLISYIFDTVISGIVMSAILITVTLFGVMLILYSLNIVRATRRFLVAFMTVGISIGIFSLFIFILYIFAPNNPVIVAFTENRWLLILVSAIVLIYGCMMLIIDFERINLMVEGGFDKSYEWVCALGLMLTIIWIYIEVLRIVALFVDRRK